MSDQERVIDKSEIETEKARLAVLAAIQIDKARRAAGLKKKDLAARLGIAPSRVTKVLDGQTNVTLHTLAQFGLACGIHWTLAPLLAQGGRWNGPQGTKPVARTKPKVS